MKKYIFLGATLCVAMAFTSCKSSESAYRKAYLKAQQRTEAQQNVTETPTVQPTVTETPTVAPVTTRPADETRVTDNTDNVTVRQENLTVVDGGGLKTYSVVVGSFSVKANAEGQMERLRSKGYAAQLGYNADRNMYRVIASTFDNKADAVQSRDQLRSEFADAWLLFAK
ncbi:MAG: SPOR domain-containing protein [Prevotella sp.]|nr:SPOR domain-containing protein [Prevotella sp.]